MSDQSKKRRIRKLKKSIDAQMLNSGSNRSRNKANRNSIVKNMKMELNMLEKEDYEKYLISSGDEPTDIFTITPEHKDDQIHPPINDENSKKTFSTISHDNIHKNVNKINLQENHSFDSKINSPTLKMYGIDSSIVIAAKFWFRRLFLDEIKP